MSIRRKIHKLSYFYKIVYNYSPLYLIELLPKLVNERSYIPLRSGHNISQYKCRTEKFKKSFFPSTISLWNTLDIDIRNSTSLSNFKLKINKIYHPLCYNKWLNFSLTRKASVLHTRLRLGLIFVRLMTICIELIVVILLYAYVAIKMKQLNIIFYYVLVLLLNVMNFLPQLHKFVEKHG